MGHLKELTMVLMPAPQMRRADLKARARAEYLEMPGMCLTLAQATRLLNASADECQGVLEELIADGLLCRVADAYVRADSGRRCA